MISFYYYNNTGWEGGLIFQNQKLGWEGGRNPIIFQNPKFPKISTVTTTPTTGVIPPFLFIIFITITTTFFTNNSQLLVVVVKSLSLSLSLSLQYQSDNYPTRLTEIRSWAMRVPYLQAGLIMSFSPLMIDPITGR